MVKLKTMLQAMVNPQVMVNKFQVMDKLQTNMSRNLLGTVEYPTIIIIPLREDIDYLFVIIFIYPCI